MSLYPFYINVFQIICSTTCVAYFTARRNISFRFVLVKTTSWNKQQPVRAVALKENGMVIGQDIDKVIDQVIDVG